MGLFVSSIDQVFPKGMDRLTAMRVFAEVARSGSFTGTANRLDMSRAMVTRYVAEMEQWLGTRLLQRTTRSVKLTNAGEQCLRRCLQVLSIVQEVEEDACSTDGQLRGQLRLTSSVSFGYAQLAPALGDFLGLHPQLKVHLDVSDGALNLVEARIDLAIRISHEPDAGLIARPLAECASLLVAAPAYLEAAGRPGHPDELPGHRCLGYTNFGRDQWRFHAADGAERLVTVPVRLTANDATVLTSAALAGAGIALQPTYLVGPLVREGKLEVVLPQWQPAVLTVYAIYPSRRHLPPAVRALLDFLAARFAGEPWQADFQPPSPTARSASAASGMRTQSGRFSSS